MEVAKHVVARSVSIVAEGFASEEAFLAICEPTAEQRAQCDSALERLSDEQRSAVHEQVWHLAKMRDSSVAGDDWGRHHCFDDPLRLARALHRLAHLGSEGLVAFSRLSYRFGEGGLGSQYYSFSELRGRDPPAGFVGVVNGMGVQSLEHAGRDAAVFSFGHDLHCVYHATHQGDGKLGFVQDVMRMKAVDGGSYNKTSHLLAQQIIDLLTANPGKKFLQIALSEGAAMCNGALRLLQQACPHLLHRVCVMMVAPAYFLSPDSYFGVEAINIVKLEDRTILPFATGASHIESWSNVLVVPHKCVNDDPHNFTTSDYMEIIEPYIRRFHATGRLRE